MRTSTFIVAIALFLNCLLSDRANAVIINLTAEADTYGRLGAGTTNFEGTTFLVKNDGGANSRKAWIRFDLDGNNEFVNDATLAFTLSSAASATSFTYRVYGLRDDFVPGSGILGNNWGETALTWDNAPANNTSSGFLVQTTNVFGGAELGSFTTSSDTAGTTLSISGPTLASFLESDTDDLVTFILVRETSNAATSTFASRTNLSFAGPLLTVDVAEVPEPSSLLLLGLGALGLVRQARRRQRRA